MKKMKFTTGVLILLFATMAVKTNAQGVFKVQGKKTHIAYNSNIYTGESLMFGKGKTSPFNGEWGIEYFQGGLNFWKPWPTANNGNYKFFIADWGCVGINCTPNVFNSNNPNSDRLHVNGRIVSRGHFTWSDERTKCQITNLSPALNKIMSLRTVSFYDRANITIGHDSLIIFEDSNQTKNFAVNNQEYCDTSKHFGLIAQEVESILPSIVSRTKSGVLAVNYIEIVPLLIKSTQEQQFLIDSQKRKIDSLNMQIQNLRQEIINWQGRTINDLEQSKTKLFQNNPNPFDGATTISYYIDENISVQNAIIEVRDIMGNLQNTIPLGDRSGLGEIQFDGSQLNMGYYVYTLKINGSTKDSKMFLKEQ